MGRNSRDGHLKVLLYAVAVCCLDSCAKVDTAGAVDAVVSSTDTVPQPIILFR